MDKELDLQKRDNSIDLMKGILVFLMILCHVLMFFPNGPIETPFTVFVGLTSFPGFMFCLGYVFPIAYSNKKDAEKRMLMGFIKTLLAFYVSGTFSLLLIQKAGFINIVDMILIRNIPGYSEFIVSFAFVYLVNIFLFKPIKKLVQNKIKFIIVAILCLAFTGFNYGTVINDFFGVFVGTYRFSSFPIIQYGFYFLIGFYVSEHKIFFNFYIYFISLGCTFLFFLYVGFYGFYPSRFPPSLTWVVGGFFIIYTYYLVCKLIKRFSFLEIAGKHSLSFLLISNVLLFTLDRLIPEPPFIHWLFVTCVFVLTTGICYAYVFISRPIIKSIKKRRFSEEIEQKSGE